VNMSETIELTKFDVHNHEPSHKTIERLALQEWIRESRRSRIPGTTTYEPKEYPTVITADKIVFELENVGKRLESLEKLMKKIMDRISKFESKQEELEFKILSYEAAQ